MIAYPIPKPPSMAAFHPAFSEVELPSLEEMVTRVHLTRNTAHSRWALEAMVIRAVLDQAINLSRIARFARQDAFEASELACEGRASTHYLLVDLQRAVMFHAMEVDARLQREDRREHLRKLRATKKQPDSPRKRQATKGEAQAGESARASMNNPHPAKGKGHSHVEG